MGLTAVATVAATAAAVVADVAASNCRVHACTIGHAWRALELWKYSQIYAVLF